MTQLSEAVDSYQGAAYSHKAVVFFAPGGSAAHELRAPVASDLGVSECVIASFGALGQSQERRQWRVC
ncbi:MAG: hypothetical protein ACHQ4H_09930 [Ktedonobacterales bacterium]